MPETEADATRIQVPGWGNIPRSWLYVPGKLYEFGVRLRLALYETGYLKPKALSNPVISVGNITLGGTGKTPLVEFIARYLTGEGHEVAILTRGYARQDRRQPRVVVSDGTQICATLAEAGDEPLMLARRLSGVKVVVGKNRYANGTWLEANQACEVHLLDDGFQHVQLQRDLNLLVLDATDPFGGGEMVPFGRLREPLYALKRADAIIVTRADQAFDEDELRWILNECGVDVPLIFSFHEVTGVYQLKDGKPQAQRSLAGKAVGVVSALGNPDRFEHDVATLGAKIVFRKHLRDHHGYSQKDVSEIVSAAQLAGAERLVTTEKDAVKLEQFHFGSLPVSVLEIKARFDDEVSLKTLLLRTIVRKQKSKRVEDSGRKTSG
ncbi:MAG TPA: tetraacyldisaccharide 4'-kinase [Acidobacteriota bacterium]|nr:tetraacyldisaccharide 4'-kinase [Acidobacteriota bacterium]